MEARLTFYFPKGTRIGDDDYEKWIQRGRGLHGLEGLACEEMAKKGLDTWFKQDGVCLTPYTSAGCYGITTDGLVILRDPNGKVVTWTNGQFAAPWWFEECPFEIEGVQARVYWMCHQPDVENPGEIFKGPYQLGDLPETQGTKGSLELERIEYGRRYNLWVNAPSLDALNAFVAGVRTGEIVPEKPWLG